MQQSINFQVYNASAGSGKTFTLVKEYLKILLTSSNIYKYQQILAVTFTNKAASEMKERIIESLHAFSNKREISILQAICAETALTKKEVFNKSKAILNAILQNYAAFNITTIDSFTHKLIRTFAYDLKLPLTFDVEMDAETLLNEAVDVVISKIGENKSLTELLIKYAIEKLDDDKAWDISNELKEFAKLILNENYAKNLKNNSKIPLEAYKELKENLQNEVKQLEKQLKEIGKTGLTLITNENLANEFYYNQLPNHFKTLDEQPKKAQFFDQNTLKRNIENQTFYSKSKPIGVKNAIDALLPTLINLYNQSEKIYQQVTLNSFIIKSLIPLAVLKHIYTSLQEIKEENNILLNAEFNEIISNTIKNEPAPFIYERIGEKFRYYFIDEMQDTSTLQWQNIIPLVQHAISSENEFGEAGKLLLVGDAKQSIYRWRGGKAEQFIDLSSNYINDPFLGQKTLSNLETNYRSYSEIVNFNNQFFKHISSFLTNKTYSLLYENDNNQKINTKIGGYVQISFVEKEANDEEDTQLAYPNKVLEIITNLEQSFQKNDICVLVRTKKQGVMVASYLSDNNIEIISSETLLINNSTKVQFILNVLKTIQHPYNKEFKVKMLYFLHRFLKVDEPIHTFVTNGIYLHQQQFFEYLKQYAIFFNLCEFIQMPFYESIEYIIRIFQVTKQSDSYLQFFLDEVLQFQQKKEMTIQGFLEYWELKKDKLSIVAPEAKNAVRIMTIHKAKGLEFPVVIFPYDLDIYKQIKPKTWYHYQQSDILSNVLIDYSKKLNYIGEQGINLYNQQREELELDNFNILYVALTRAVEQLYIITEKKVSKDNNENLNYTSGFFINYLKKQKLWNQQQSDYSFGSSQKILKTVQSKSATIFQKQFISNSWKNHQISIVANSSILWGSNQEKSISYGNLIHEILSKVTTANDIHDVLTAYVFKGIISNEEEKQLNAILNNIVSHPQLTTYFNQNNQVYLEQEIVTNDKNIIIPDRIVVANHKTTIIDYKTGNPNKKYHQQLHNYAQVLEQLNFKIHKKLLVYINQEIIVEEV